MAGEVFQISTGSIQELGRATVNGAQEEKISANPEALNNLRSDLSAIVPHMPHILQGVLTQFNTNFSKRYGDVLDQRIAIGHILQGAATLSEKQDVQTSHTFASPQALPIP